MHDVLAGGAAMPVQDQELAASLHSLINEAHAPSSSNKLPLHAVVVPWPGQGHINPLLHLSKRLASEFGFSITFVNLDFTHRLIQNTSLLHSHESSPAQQQEGVEEDNALHAELDIKFVSLPDGVPTEATRTSNVPDLSRGVLHSGPAFERLLADMHPPPTCVISDIFVLHTQDAANKLGIPRVAFWTQSAASFSAHVAAARGLFPHECGEGKVIQNIAGAPMLRFKDLPGFLQTYREPDFMFDFVTRPFTRLEEAHCVHMNSFEAMEGEALEVLRNQMPKCKFYMIGPVLPVDYFGSMILRQNALNRVSSFWAEDYSCLKWLDKQQEASVLYVSFGSIAELSEQELHEFALGLEATCFPILWVLRPGVLKSGGHVSLPPGFQDSSNGRIFVIEWAPQLHVLAHPSVGAFFTHAGWNSTLEGVSQGKPLLGFPYFADQMLNCKCIEEFWHNGLALERHGEGLLTRSLVESTARTLMSDAKLRETALLLCNGAREAILSKQQGSSTSSLNSFVESLRAKSNP